MSKESKEAYYAELATNPNLVFPLINSEGMSIYDLSEKSGLPIRKILSVLLELEIADKICKMSKEIGKLLRDQRLAMGLSQTEIALKIGLEYKTVGRIERGEGASYANMEKYAELLGLNVEIK